MTVQSFRHLIALFVTAVVLSGCASVPSKSLSTSDRAALKTIRINPNVELPKEMFYHGRAQSFAAVGGIVGAVVADSLDVTKQPAQAIQVTMQKNGVSLPEIVKAEFQRAANGQTMTFAENLEKADGELTLTVQMYGFSQTQGFSALLYPNLKITASLKGRDGTLAWQESEFITPLNAENTLGHTVEQYVAEPELLRATLTNAAGIVSRLLVQDMRKQ